MPRTNRVSKLTRIAPLAIALAIACTIAGAIDWPTKAIEVVVPHNPGGENDLNMRRFAKYLEKEIGQRIIIVNMAGAGATVGMNNVRASKPDGYRAICYATAGQIAEIIGMMDCTLTEAFDIAATHVIDKYNVFIANGDVPYNNVAELVEYAKANPGEVNFGTEFGAFSHVTVLALADLAGVEFNIIDAGTASEKTTAILGGRLDATGSQYGLIQQYVDTGEVKCLGILSEERQPGAENVPTVREAGYDLVFERVFFVGFPKGTDPEIIAKFNEASKRVYENPDYVAECKAGMAEAHYMTPEDATAYFEKAYDDYNKYRDLLRQN